MEEKNINNKSHPIKIFFANLIGLILAFLVQSLTIMLAKWLFIDIIGNIPFIPKLLSWPVDYYYYAYTGAMFAGVYTSISTCNFFCNLVNSKLNYATLIFGIISSIYYLIIMISTFINNGFSFSFMLISVFIVLAYLYFAFSSAHETDI